jgi:hypothetical protein
MKFYRSIEFSKLLFLLNEERQFLWEAHQISRDKLTSGNLHHNWWMNDKFSKERREIVSAVINEPNDSFFRKSLEFNAMSGGRFNPERSFGVLYTANHPAIAALEVLYHKFIDLHPVYSGIQAKKAQITSGLDMKIPDELEVLIIAFEIQIENSEKLHKINDNPKDLKKVCDQIGFGRYTTRNFDREFIFGNDYEISRHLGTYIHSLDKYGFTVPSARIHFEDQDDLELRNAIFFEGKTQKLNPTLTGNFVEYKCRVDLKNSDSHGLDVTINVNGKKSHQTTFKLQHMPPKRAKSDHPQVRSYLPEVSIDNARPRSVLIQKYFVPKPNPTDGEE